MAIPERSAACPTLQRGLNRSPASRKSAGAERCSTAPGTRCSEPSRYRGSRRVRCRRLVVHSSDGWLDMSERSMVVSRERDGRGIVRSTARSTRGDVRRKKEAKRLARPNWGDTGRWVLRGEIPEGLHSGDGNRVAQTDRTGTIGGARDGLAIRERPEEGTRWGFS